MSAADNVAQGLLYSGVPVAERRRRAAEQLRGSGSATVAIARHSSRGRAPARGDRRALVARPSIVFADEPTGNLDSRSGEQVVALLRELNAYGTTIVVITHDLEVAASLPRRVHIRDGRVERDERMPAAGAGDRPDPAGRADLGASAPRTAP